MQPEPLSNGLTILRASRLEALVPPLHTLLEATKPDGILAPQTVIAAHPGMKQWLTGALARHVGPGRIVANLDVRLPSAWLDGLSDSLLGRNAVALPNYRRPHLRWTLHGMLANPLAHGVDDPRVLGYLERAGNEGDRALRRFQLADRLARVYSQYLVYRRDWLEAWEAGKWPFATAKSTDAGLHALEARLLGPLWKDAAARLGAHRGQLMQLLTAELANPLQPLEPLHVFGLSHLPPVELELLRQYARSAPVFLYAPDPCREYWGGREKHHLLLDRWGRMGQDFFASLVEGGARGDTRHSQDESAEAPSNRLQRLQESIRGLDPALMHEDARAEGARGDASLRIHACHAPQRELEVLRDALLDAVQSGVKPGGIVVMAPDIQAYLPLIPAVFGEPGSARERLLPYHLADVPVAGSHPLFQAFEALLDIGSSRVTAPEVVDLLAVAEVRRALGLGGDAADTLVDWLRNSRVAWGLDGAHKAALSLPARSENTFAWAMDRLIAGYLMADGMDGDAGASIELPDQTCLLPVAGIDGPTATALGSLDRLLCELQAWRDLAETAMPASDWANRLRIRVDALFRIDGMDADARAAQSVLHRTIANIAAEPDRNGEDPELRMPVVRELLLDALATTPERQRFLMGGITFCGMVPQRAIPFDMVCVLGLDEGVFPRRPSDGGVDLMSRLRRAGDRDVPGDDRYLFLETLMSARKRLHLGYIGQGVRDGKPRNPAAPLAELMAELDRQCGNAPDDIRARRPWLVRHPLQPFDRRYFESGAESDVALFSYSSRFAGMTGRGMARLPRLRDGEALPLDALPESVSLSSLLAWFKDPARALLRDHLQVSLDGLDADSHLPDEEPLDGVSRIHTVARTVFFDDALPRACADPEWTWDGAPPAWVTHGGLLPPGAGGQAAWNAEATAVAALLDGAAASGRFDARAGSGGVEVQVDVATGTTRIVGKIGNVFPLDGTALGKQVVLAFPDADKGLKKGDALGFKERIPAFLHWALLRLVPADAGEPAPVRLTMLADGDCDLAVTINAWDEAYCNADASTRARLDSDLRGRLGVLVERWIQGRAGKSYYYPRSAGAALASRPGGSDVLDSLDSWMGAASGKVADTWKGGWNSGGERDYAPGFAHFLEGDLVFGDPDSDPGRMAIAALLQEAAQLDDVIMLREFRREEVA